MIYIANWKMHLSFANTLDFYQQHGTALAQLSTRTGSTIVLCPSLVALAPLAPLLHNTPLKLGAQFCAAHASGPYTGQVDAQSLSQVGCSYVVVNHSETRALLRDPDAFLRGQLVQLMECQLTPIICLGETKEEYTADATQRVLSEALHHLQPILTDLRGSYLLAYEPIWAIGSSITPTISELESVYHHICQTVDHLGITPPAGSLYGGSVNPSTMPLLAESSCFDGYLIGSASLDFQTFEKIVSWKK